MKIYSPRRRKAISPVLATVILIAITLIAAIAIAGFVFGLFGTFTNGANMQLSVVSCVSANDTCQLRITNSGGSSGSITGCSLYGTTAAVSPSGGVAGTITVKAGTTANPGTLVHCKGPPALVAGSAVTGSLVVASGSPLAFSAIAS